MRIRGWAGLALGASLLCTPVTARATTIFGAPVDAANVATGNVSGNEVLYFNPLNCGVNGLYGSAVGIGTTASAGSGCGYDAIGVPFGTGPLDGESLRMILRFVGATAGPGVLTFDFKDLDLVPVNSTTITGQPNFFEGIQFFLGFDGTNYSNPLTSVINELTDVDPSYTIVGSVTPPLDGTDTSGPHSTNVTITFPNFAIPSASFNIYASFGSCSLSQPTWGGPPAPFPTITVPVCTQSQYPFPRDNTQETLTAKLEFQDPPQIPEPASMMLLGSGLVGLAAKVRNKKRAKTATT